MYCYKCNNWHDADYPGCTWTGDYFKESNSYFYKCPDCNGEFNLYVTRGFMTANFPTHHCPFCNKEMKGLGNG